MAPAISPEDLTYPDHPDAAGQARKQYRGETFYFGAHNTPDSIILFGKWKGKLVETGKPVKPASAIDAPSAEVAATPPRHSFFWPAIIAAAIVSGAILSGAWISSTSLAPTVDGLVLSVDELEVVRGLRDAEMNLARHRSNARIAELTRKLMEEGVSVGKLHETGSDTRPLHLISRDSTERGDVDSGP